MYWINLAHLLHNVGQYINTTEAMMLTSKADNYFVFVTAHSLFRL